MADKRAFTIEINGLEKSYKDAESLLTALSKLPPLIDTVNKSSANTSRIVADANKQSKERKAALTDEEKAENKLVAAIDKATNARTQANRAQVDANAAAKEAQRQVQLEQNAINSSANSIEEMRANLALLKNEWKKTEINSDQFVDLSEQIKTLNQELKEQESLIGDNQRNVGNYQDATAGLKDQLDSLSQSVNAAAQNSKAMLQLFQAGVTTFALFGDQSESTKDILTSVSKVVAALSLVQKLNNGVLSKSIIIEKAKIVTDALVTRGLITQTTAQTALNVATAAFPLLAIIALLGTFIALTSLATEKTNSFKSSMDNVSFATKEARDAHDDLARSIRDIQIEIDLATGKITDYEVALARLDDIKLDKMREEARRLKDSLKELDDEYSILGKLSKSWSNYVNGEGSLAWSDLNKEKDDKGKTLREESARIFETIDKDDQKNQELLNTKQNNAILKQNEENRVANLKGLEQSIAKNNKAREEEYEKAVATNEAIIESNKKLPKEKQIERIDLDLINKKYDKLDQEARESAAKQAQSQHIQNLEKQKAVLEKERDLIRKAEDDKTNLIGDKYEKRNKQIENQYSRQREDLQRQLDTDKDLTEQGREAIRQVIANIDKHIQEDQNAVLKEQSEKRLNDEKSYLDMMVANYERAYSDIANMPKTIKQSNGLIDVQESQKNYDSINKQLSDYAKNLESSKKDISKYYDDLIATYDKDSVEFAQATHDKETALHSINSEVKSVNAEIANNNKESLDLSSQYWAEYSQKVSEFIGNLSAISSSIFDGINMIAQTSIDASKEKLEELTKAYDDAVAKREESDSRLEALSERAKSAEGNRSAAIISQLNQEMEKNKALADQESSLAKQKEKLEADIAKKERQMKKTQLVSDISAGISGTALAVINALQVKPFPLGVVLASVAGSMGAAQVGVMTQQLAKMEKGGLLKGKRHAQGGMKIEGTNIEVEGDEYVVNRVATQKNLPLLEHINKYNTVPNYYKETVNVREIITNNTSMLPHVEISESETNKKLDTLNETLTNKNFSPVVSVVDINHVQNQVAVTDHLTGT